MTAREENDSTKIKETVSRQDFLKFAGATGLALGIGGLSGLGDLFNRQAEASHQPSTNCCIYADRLHF